MIVDPLSNRVLNGRFTILEPIGSGGMATVYRAIQSPLDRVVALKILNSKWHLDTGFRQRFFLEASLTSKLRHPNTVTVIDYGETEDGIFYLAMEYLDGKTLSQVLADSELLHWTRCLDIGQQICRSLREAHKLGIVHRDLKPSNAMLLTEDGEQDLVKVLDFGLVKSFVQKDDARQGEISNPGIFLGSPRYMAPEQLRGRADPRTDVYSLGALLYHLLVGRPPFVANTAIEIIYQQVNEAPPPMRSVRSDLKLGEKVESLVMKCLEKEPSCRFQSMDEVLDALRSAALDPKGSTDQVSQSQSQVAPHPGPFPADEPTLELNIGFSKDRRRRFLIPAVLLLIGSLAAATIFTFGIRGRSEKTALVVDPEASDKVPGPRPQGRSKTSTVAFRISTDPHGAAVSVNGKTVGATPLVIQVPAEREGQASAKLEFSLDGFQTLTMFAAGFGPEVVVEQSLKAITTESQSEETTEEAALTPQPEKDASARTFGPSGTAESRGGLGESPPRSSSGTKVALLRPAPLPAEGNASPEAPGTNRSDAKGEDGTETASAGVYNPAAIVGTQAVQARSSARIELDESNIQLTKISGPDPEYTQKAIDNEVEGVMLVKCLVTVEGAVQNCRVSRSLPFMDRAVVFALERGRYKPYLLNGKPEEIDYTFKVKLNLPR
jgi:serine/threonine-protein kinase